MPEEYTKQQLLDMFSDNIQVTNDTKANITTIVPEPAEQATPEGEQVLKNETKAEINTAAVDEDVKAIDENARLMTAMSEEINSNKQLIITLQGELEILRNEIAKVSGIFTELEIGIDTKTELPEDPVKKLDQIINSI